MEDYSPKKMENKKEREKYYYQANKEKTVEKIA